MLGMVVSLLVRLWVEMILSSCVCFVLESASSWGCELKFVPDDLLFRVPRRQPPREAVSWNDDNAGLPEEKKRQPPREAVSWNVDCADAATITELVSLLVRLWVEMWFRLLKTQSRYVSLLVRLWVEMSKTCSRQIGHKASASSWGCELKFSVDRQLLRRLRQPPREAVSWNVNIIRSTRPSRTSASSWGCELKCHKCSETFRMR